MADQRELYRGLQAAAQEGRLTLEGRRVLRSLRNRMLETETAPTTTAQRMAIGAGKKLRDIPRGIKQLGLQIGEATGLADPGSLADYMNQIDQEMRFYSPLAELYPISTGFGEAVGEASVTAPVPVIGRTMPGRMMSATGTEAVAGGLEYQPSGDLSQRLLSGAERGVGGMAGQGLSEGIMSAVRGVRGPEIPPTQMPGDLGPELQEQVPAAQRPPQPYGYWDEEFGIPYTEGLYTGRLGRQKVEERMRHGAYGPRRQQELDDLTAFMRARGEGAFRGMERDIAQGPVESAPIAARNLSRRMSQAADELWGDVDEAFELAKANRSYLTPEDTQGVISDLRNTLDQYDLISPEQTPATHQLLERLDTFIPQAQEGQEIVGMDAKGLHALRMTINNLRDSAANNLDRRNLGTLRHALDQKMLELADSGRLMGDEIGIRALQEGIRLRANYGRLYGPQFSRSRSGRLRRDAVGQKIEDLVEDQISAEDFAQWAFGKTTLDPGGNWGKVTARVVDAYGIDSPEHNLTKNIFLERFRESALNPQTGMISPAKLNTLWTRLKRQPERLGQVMSREEAARFDRLVKAFKRMEPRRDAVNFSNTAHTIESALEDMTRKAVTAAGAATGGPAGAVAAYAGMGATEKLASFVKRFFGQRVFEPRALLHPTMGLVRSTSAAAVPRLLDLSEEEERTLMEGPGF